jgi:hypothetical protein
MPATYEPITTTTVANTTTTQITISSIPQTYTDLKMVIVAGSGGSLRMWLNNSNSTELSDVTLAGQAANVYGTYSASTTKSYIAGIFDVMPSGASNYGLYTVDIFGYTGTSANKGWLATEAGNLGNTGVVSASAGVYRNTSAITRIDLDLFNSTGFTSGSTITLYGILKA